MHSHPLRADGGPGLPWSVVSTTDDMSQQLAHGLRPRHLTMMGLGSAIGAGLFLGSGLGIAAAGPAVLLNAVGSALLVVWLLVVVSQLRLRPRLEAAAAERGEPLRLRAWGYPWLSWVTLAALLAVVGLMLSDAAARSQIAATAGLVVVILVVYAIARAVRRVPAEPARPRSGRRSADRHRGSILRSDGRQPGLRSSSA
jgi:L-asparagine transporter-like permease